MDRSRLDCDDLDSDPSEAFDWEYQAFLEERNRTHHVDGVPVTGKDYPPCLNRRSFDCDACSFYFESRFEDECRLRRARAKRLAIWEVIRPWAEMEWRREALRKALEHELRMHGRELHYTVLVRMVRERYPHFRESATEYTISRILCASPETFERLAPGLYRLASGAEPSRRSE